jgi:hypothetical protein
VETVGNLRRFKMKQIILMMVLAAMGICLCGCQEKVTMEKHETIITQEIVSEEIIVQ